MLTNVEAEMELAKEKIEADKQERAEFSDEMDFPGVQAKEKIEADKQERAEFSDEMDFPGVQVEKFTKKTLNIHSLPDEVIIKIFGNLSHNELISIARVCRKWRILTRSPVLWKRVDVEFNADSDAPINDITLKFLRNLSLCTSRIKLCYYVPRPWALPLNFAEFSSNLQSVCPNLEVLVLNLADYNCNFSSVIHLCGKFLQNLRILCVSWCTFADYSIEDCNDICKIEVLSINSRWISNRNKPPFSKMPCLKVLHITVDDANSWFEHDASFLSNLERLILSQTNISRTAFQNISRMALNLTELCLCGSHAIDAEALNFNDSRNVFPQLKIICIDRCENVRMDGVLSLIRSCRSLQKIYVSKYVWKEKVYAEQPFAKYRQLEIIKREFCTLCPYHKSGDDYFNN